MSFQQRAALAIVPAIVILSTAAVVHADVIVHGRVLTLLPQAHAFRILMTENNREKTIFVTERTEYFFSNGKKATLADVKVGRTVEVKGTEKSRDAYTASRVSIRA